MKVTFGAFRGHFDVALSISTSNFICDACVMHTCTGLVGPKTGKVKKLLVFKAFLKGPSYPRADSENERLSGPGHFWATLGSLWVYSGDFGSLYDYFGIIVELLWM